LYVLPSGIDGTRPALLDQMGFGNCVLVRNSLSNCEVIGDAGYVFDRDDPVASLREQLSMLLSKPDIVKEYRNRSQQRVREAYSWEVVTDKYQKLFENLKSEIG